VEASLVGCYKGRLPEQPFSDPGSEFLLDPRGESVMSELARRIDAKAELTRAPTVVVGT
jgi:hypothetical protein